MLHSVCGSQHSRVRTRRPRRTNQIGREFSAVLSEVVVSASGPLHFLKFFKDFIYSFMRDPERGGDPGQERGRPHAQSPTGTRSWDPESRPGPKAGTQPLSPLPPRLSLYPLAFPPRLLLSPVILSTRAWTAHSTPPPGGGEPGTALPPAPVPGLVFQGPSCELADTGREWSHLVLEILE